MPAKFRYCACCVCRFYVCESYSSPLWTRYPDTLIADGNAVASVQTDRRWALCHCWRLRCVLRGAAYSSPDQSQRDGAASDVARVWHCQVVSRRLPAPAMLLQPDQVGHLFRRQHQTFLLRPASDSVDTSFSSRGHGARRFRSLSSQARALALHRCWPGWWLRNAATRWCVSNSGGTLDTAFGSGGTRCRLLLGLYGGRLANATTVQPDGGRILVRGNCLAGTGGEFVRAALADGFRLTPSALGGNGRWVAPIAPLKRHGVLPGAVSVRMVWLLLAVAAAIQATGFVPPVAAFRCASMKDIDE